MMDAEQRADEAIKHTCPKCHRPPGRACQRVGGRSFRPMTGPHAARIALVPDEAPRPVDQTPPTGGDQPE